MAPGASVAVLLCTCNGAAFLTEQLDSIAAQRGPAVRLYVSDDGSSDATPRILESYRQRWGGDRLSIRRGPCRGYVANFLSLICSPDIDADYYAYADQDDLWDTDKLARALGALASPSGDRPALYCSRTRLISESGSPVGYSPLFRKPPGFANALVQNIAGGNTMVFNRAARDLLLVAGEVDVVTHDWWTYLLVTGAGGRVVYDARPSVSYRQHGANLIGSNMGMGERVDRLVMALRGRKREWNDRNIDALQRSRALLAADSVEVLDEFCRARQASLLTRVRGIRKSGIYAQTLAGNLGIIAATFLKKI